MKEDQYHALCKACDELLLEPGASSQRIAIPWLHVIRPHPIFLDNYRQIIEGRVTANFLMYLRNFAATLIRLIRSFLVDHKLKTKFETLSPNCDLLIISHLVTGPGVEDDFYFGSTAKELADRGFSSTTALINYTKVKPSISIKKQGEAVIQRLILAPTLGFMEEWSLYRGAAAEAKRLKKRLGKHLNVLSRRVTERAKVEAVSGGTVSALRLGEQVKVLITRLQPSAIVVTYEGHSWERVVFASARSVSPRIQCIGYQHAALFRHQHAAQRKLGSIYTPDTILTSGKLSEMQLKRSRQLEGIKIVTAGSCRSFVRRKIIPPSLGSTTEKRTCLVLPEGIVSECNLLFGYSLMCAQSIPHVKFIWRLHPNMRFNDLIDSNPKFRELPSNIKLSTLTLLEDIQCSQWALYRGSTAIIQAIMSGLLPIYLHRNDEIQIDTLHELAPGLRMQVSTFEDFNSFVKAPESIFKTKKNNELLQDFCEQMFTRLNAEVFASCVTWNQ